MRKIVLPLILIIITINTLAQKAIVEGKITDSKTGVAIPSITISVENENITKVADVEGRYSISLETGKKYAIKISGIGYKTKILDEVTVIAGQTTLLDINLDAANKTENEVVVRSTARKETTASLIAFQKNTSVVAQVVSAEAIRRSPDKNTGEILKRVPGLSIQEGRYVIVRGLADRYNQAMLNGILLSSTEPDRKTFSFDIFPASVIDNIIINKAFIPELPGEWAGGLIQVNTKDVPSKNFLNVQVGTGFNTNVIGKDFYTYKGSNTDFLGFDNNVRTLPDDFPTKSNFNLKTDADKLTLGKQIATNWAINKVSPSPNASFQLNGGIATKLFGKKLGGVVSFNYNRSFKHQIFNSSFFQVSTSNQATADFIYNNDKYVKDASWGGIGNVSLQLNTNNKISFKNLLNINTSDYVLLRTGQEYLSGVDNIRNRELSMRTNIFYNTQLTGDHNIPSLKAKINWYGSFNILNQDIPQQRRLEYIQTNQTGPYEARVSTGQSQKSGSVFYSSLSDYIYTAGGDVTKSFTLFNNKQTIKAGYFFQVKDRLFNSRPFFIKLFDNSLKTLPEDQVFAEQNFATGKLGFDEFSGKQFRYIANSIMNAGYLQLDNNFSDKFRVVYGVRYENFDQVVGSLKESDPRYFYSKIGDFLPAINMTYKLNPKTNIRLAGSQTLIRPEFRELSGFAFYDFELGATVLGNNKQVRTKVTNIDLRYELYPRAGELFTLGVFYKNFKSPIELYLNQSGAGSSNTFNYINNENTEANGFGVELELRKKLDFVTALQNFTVSSNIAYIYNNVTDANANLNRPMQGQSPYVFNVGLNYDLEKYGITSSILFNQIGRRIAFVGNDQLPAIWEAPRALLDFQIAKKVINNKGEIKFSASDILNQQQNFYHNLNDNKKYDAAIDALAISRKLGTTLAITFAYTIK